MFLAAFLFEYLLFLVPICVSSFELRCSLCSAQPQTWNSAPVFPLSHRHLCLTLAEFRAMKRTNITAAEQLPVSARCSYVFLSAPWLPGHLKWLLGHLAFLQVTQLPSTLMIHPLFFCRAVLLFVAFLTLFISARSLMSSSNQRPISFGTSKGPAGTSEVQTFVPFLPHQGSLNRRV